MRWWVVVVELRARGEHRDAVVTGPFGRWAPLEVVFCTCELPPRKGEKGSDRGSRPSGVGRPCGGGWWWSSVDEVSIEMPWLLALSGGGRPLRWCFALVSSPHAREREGVTVVPAPSGVGFPLEQKVVGHLPDGA